MEDQQEINWQLFLELINNLSHCSSKDVELSLVKKKKKKVQKLEGHLIFHYIPFQFRSSTTHTINLKYARARQRVYLCIAHSHYNASFFLFFFLEWWVIWVEQGETWVERGAIVSEVASSGLKRGERTAPWVSYFYLAFFQHFQSANVSVIQINAQKNTLGMWTMDLCFLCCSFSCDVSLHSTHHWHKVTL